MNIKFDSDEGLPLKKNLKLCELIIFVGSAFLWGQEIISTSFLR